MNIRNSSDRFAVAILVAVLTFFSRSPLAHAEAGGKPSVVNKRVKEVSLDVTDFGEGWQATVKYPEVRGVTDTTCKLWVEDGWFHAARVSEIGVEWRLVFAKITEGIVPHAIQYEGPSIEISYGEYFIRDNSVVLRSLRPPLTPERPTFTATDVLQTTFKKRGYVGIPESGFLLSALTDDTWYYATSGTSREEFNVFIRLNPRELHEPRYGFGSMTDNLRQAFHGDCWTLDDGELLVARYTPPAEGQLKLNAKKIKEHMADNTPPELDAAKWFNVEQPLSLEKLKGKVVLLDFWATTCGPCIKKLPEVQKLYDKYAEKGLVVIGMHMPESLGACEKFVKGHNFTFPFMLDAGKTAESYGVSSNPTYFLISREGKVVSGYDTTPPSEEMIEMLLKQ